MKKNRHILCISIIILNLLIFSAYKNRPQQDVQTSFESPNGHIVFDIELINKALNFSVSFNNKKVISTSPILMTIGNELITKNINILSSESFKKNESYKRIGFHSLAINNYNGSKLRLQTKDGKDCFLEIRVFNDAAAFRLIVPGEEDKYRVPDESTIFNLPKESVVWHHNLRGHYEAVHQKGKLSEIQVGTWIAPPATLQLPDSLGYMSITEANLKNYSGMAFQVDSSQAFQIRLAHDHPVSYPYELRYSKEDISHLSKPASVKGDIITPWRVVMLGKDLNTLVNSDVIFNLNPAPDKNYFPNGIDTEWIRPGRAVWKYLDGGGEGNLENMKEFSRLAAELGFEHNILEGFWRNWSDDEIKELIEYSNKRGVQIWVWEHSKSLRDPNARHAFLQRVHDLGISGIKVDFFDHEAKEVIDLYQDILKESAEHKILVDFHGANKPTGEARTWPNELTREAVRGIESRNVDDKARHNTTLPFTRFLAGPAEYTPVHFGERMGNTTWTHQIASAVILSAPLLTYAASPQHILDNPGVDMIKSIPSTWDETIVLPISEIGKIAAFARRKKEDWFLSIMNGSDAKTVDIPLNFLSDKKYEASIIKDDPKIAASLLKDHKFSLKGDTLRIQLSAGGGYLAHFKIETDKN